MKTKQSLMMLLMTMFWITSALGQPTIPPSCFTDSHDITSLHAWGPYSKRYAGISHIPDMKAGMRFDFSVMPGPQSSTGSSCAFRIILLPMGYQFIHEPHHIPL